MRIVSVNASKKYSVYIERDLSGFDNVSPVFRGGKVAIISDDNVSPLYGNMVGSNIRDKEVYSFVIPHGERGKSGAVYFDVMNFLARNGFTRSDAIVALGGGVVGDLAAFCASTYMRGITLVAMPTTLLAAIDSSVGGKTAINLDCGKNLCGTFYQPDAVYIDTAFLKTLPEREILCGEGEMIKYAFLSDTLTLEDISGGDAEDVIEKCVRIKAAVIGRDERESGERKLLNLGHTIGHAIERLSDFTISHGECVAKGLHAILDISAKYYGFDNETYMNAEKIIKSKGHDLTVPYSPEEIMREIKHDKKSDGDGIDAVLIDKDLSAKVVYFTFDKFKEALRWI